jgi:hypothetical protein
MRLFVGHMLALYFRIGCCLGGVLTLHDPHAYAPKTPETPAACRQPQAQPTARHAAMALRSGTALQMLQGSVVGLQLFNGWHHDSSLLAVGCLTSSAAYAR